jgi:hypothetical protein
MKYWNYFVNVIKIKLSYMVAFNLAVILSACSSVPHSQVETIDHRNIEFSSTQHSTTPVIFESGLGGTMEWWKAVLQQISDDTTTFAYNRPGYGKSERVLTDRDADHIVSELRLLLHHKNIKPPYILVGHSLGGLYMQFFARRYPEEIKALILVDSTHPKQLEGEGAIDRQSFLVRGLLGVLVTGSAKDELSYLSKSGEQVLNLPTIQHLPVYVLSASKPMQEKSALADDSNEKRKDIARLYPGSIQIWVNSGHGIPLENPASVVSAIRDIQMKEKVN